MDPLIADLKRQHAALVECLNAVHALGIGSPAGQQKLMSAKTLLLAHVRTEDDKLYPVLRKAAASDPDLQRTLETLGREMAEVSAGAMRFFNQYAGGGAGMDFARDFGKLSHALTTRIRREETTLYPAFERVRAATPAASGR